MDKFGDIHEVQQIDLDDEEIFRQSGNFRFAQSPLEMPLRASGGDAERGRERTASQEEETFQIEGTSKLLFN